MSGSSSIYMITNDTHYEQEIDIIEIKASLSNQSDEDFNPINNINSIAQLLVEKP